jgi:stage V sporulation protein B
MLSGFAIAVVLPRVLSQALYGLYGVVVGAVSVINNVVVTGTVQAVAKLTSERDDDAETVKRGALAVMAVVGGMLATAFALSAPLLARFWRDTSLVDPLRITAGIIACYALYSVLVGAANGLRQFDRQAGLDITYSTLRAGLIVGGAAIGGSVLWAVAGFLGAAMLILPISLLAVGLRAGSLAGFDTRRFLAFAFQLALYLVLLNLLMTVDLFLLKRYAVDLHRAQQGGVAASAEALAELANGTSGLYFAAQNFSRLPYQAVIAVTFVIFPLVSKATFENNLDQARSYIETTLRYSLVAVAAMAVIFIGVPDGVLALVMKPVYGRAAPTLAVLAIGYVGFALFAVVAAIVNGAGRPMVSVVACGAGLAASAAAVAALGSAAPGLTEPQLLLFTAVASAAGMWLAVVISLVFVRRRFSASLPALTLGRVALAVFCAAALVRVVALPGKAAAIGRILLCLVTYVGLLVATRELGPADLARVRQVLLRKR